MTDIRGLKHWLPSLRRYARAISGSQRRGDALCFGALETLANKDGYPLGHETRVCLYQALSELWNGPTGQHIAALPPDSERPVDRRIRAMTPRSRQAFLLITMEGLSASDVMQILGVTKDELHALLALARREVSSQLVTDVLIIEDEVFIARDLENIVERLGHSVVGKVRTREAAREVLRSRKPGLILADIQLADGSSGIDAVNDALRLQGDLPVIFITAYPEQLLTGERPEPTFLIAKPFQVKEVQAAISQVLYFESLSTSGPAGSAPAIVKFNDRSTTTADIGKVA